VVSVPNFYFKIDKSVRIAICVPVRDNVTATFSYSLAMLMKKCGEGNLKVSIHYNIGSEVAMQRQKLVEEALETNPTHILWLDSDMKFPSDIIHRLLSHNKPVVACNYSTRVEPLSPVAFTSDGDLESRLYKTTGTSNVFAVGLGCMLVNTDVFKDMDLPYFSVTWNEDYTNLVGEDIYFCNKIKEQGYDILVDNDTSQHIAHVGTKAYKLDEINDWK
jgi:hypothetical protein